MVWHTLAVLQFPSRVMRQIVSQYLQLNWKLRNRSLYPFWDKPPARQRGKFAPHSCSNMIFTDEYVPNIFFSLRTFPSQPSRLSPSAPCTYLTFLTPSLTRLLLAGFMSTGRRLVPKGHDDLSLPCLDLAAADGDGATAAKPGCARKTSTSKAPAVDGGDGTGAAAVEGAGQPAARRVRRSTASKEAADEGDAAAGGAAKPRGRPRKSTASKAATDAEGGVVEGVAAGKKAGAGLGRHPVLARHPRMMQQLEVVCGRC